MTELTLGQIYDRLSASEQKRLCFFLYEIVDFYADTDTWFATTLRSDPPCGAIMSDIRLAGDGRRRPGGRARLALSWVHALFERASTRMFMVRPS